MSQHIDSLYTDFQRKSGSKLTQEQFERMVYYFPALLVVASDGKVDEQEWVYIRYLAKFIAETFPKGLEGDLVGNYVDSLAYLVNYCQIWENRFLDALKFHLSKYPEVKEDVRESLYLFAEASEGQSTQEEQKIQQLISYLNL